MTYSLKIHQDRVTRYLRDYEWLSRQARIRLFANLHSDLRGHGDFYRNDPDRRLAPGSSFFWYQIVIKDDEGDGRIRQFSFVVNDQPCCLRGSACRIRSGRPGHIRIKQRLLCGGDGPAANAGRALAIIHQMTNHQVGLTRPSSFSSPHLAGLA